MLERNRPPPNLPKRKHGERQSSQQLDRLTPSLIPERSSPRRRLGQRNLLPCALLRHMEEIRPTSGTIQLEFENARCLLLSTEARIRRVDLLFV